MKCATTSEKLEKKDEKDFAKCPRVKMRRGSSMSDIDKLTAAKHLPDLVRSADNRNYLSPGSLPQTPHLSRSYLNAPSPRPGERTERAESIGDLMNQKKYGSNSNWSVRSETLVARTVPLSTVTPKHSPSGHRSVLTSSFSELSVLEPCPGPLTVAQRTQRLSRLIRQKRNYETSRNMWVCRIFVAMFSESFFLCIFEENVCLYHLLILYQIKITSQMRNIYNLLKTNN